MSAPLGRRDQWAQAYIAQARSDWEVFKKLGELGDIETCHRLHYLQMACEKLAKAYRFRDTDTQLDALLTHHVGFPKFFNAFFRSPRMRERFQGRGAKLLAIQQQCNRLAREVEKLAPAVDRGNSPENAEYPWASGQEIIVPSRFEYPKLSLLREPGGRSFLGWTGLALRSFDEVELA